ncbi:MAG: tetratricopeptide repeat protein [Planctomycetota bacterium]|nr:tetratricopeptide repeat protein [Planctomycetota bacterium]
MSSGEKTLRAIYSDALQTQYFKNDAESALEKYRKAKSILDTGKIDDTPLMFSVPSRIEILEENFAAARSHAEAGLLFFHNDADLILCVANCEVHDGNTRMALKLTDQAFEALSKDAGDLTVGADEIRAIACLIRGDAWGQENEFSSQIEEYENAHSQVSKFPLAHELMGHAYLERGNNPRALEQFKRASSSGLFMPWSMLGLGIAYKNMGDFRSAITEFYRLIDNASSDKVLYRAYRNLASCFYRKKEYDQARELYGKALEYSPRDIPTLCDLAIVCMEDEQYDDASDFLRMAIKQSMAHSVQSRELVRKGMSIVNSIPASDAARRFQRTKRINSDEVTRMMAYLYTGIVFESQKKYNDAKLMYDKVTEIAGEDEYREIAVKRITNLQKTIEDLFVPEEEEEIRKEKPSPKDKPVYVNFSKFRRTSYRR